MGFLGAVSAIAVLLKANKVAATVAASNLGANLAVICVVIGLAFIVIQLFTIKRGVAIMRRKVSTGKCLPQILK